MEDDLFFMFLNPEVFPDEKGCDIRLALLRGKLERLATAECRHRSRALVAMDPEAGFFGR